MTTPKASKTILDLLNRSIVREILLDEEDHHDTFTPLLEEI